MDDFNETIKLMNEAKLIWREVPQKTFQVTKLLFL